MESIGPYRILEEIGSGAMGVVFLAEDTRLHRKVALKTLAHERRFSDKARSQLMHEAQAAARLTHPNVAAIYDVVESPQGVHVVMEYVEGETLAARLRRGRLPAGQVIRIGRQIAEALAKAHQMGIVHRDLKPGNVMLEPSGSVKILDFGLAEFVEMADEETGDGDSEGSVDRRVVGTPGYIPPERLLGRGSDSRGDIYSLGIMLFELLTGRLPFEEEDVEALTLAALTQTALRPRDVDPSIPTHLDDIVSRAIARNPEDRPSSATELAAILRREEELSSDRTRTLALPSLDTLRNAQKRRVLARVAGGLVLVAIITVLIFWQREKRPEAPEMSPEIAAELTQARSFLERQDRPGSLEHAIGLFQRVIEKEPKLAVAHAGLGRAYWLQYLESRDNKWADNALMASTEALRLDPELADAHLLVAVVYNGRGKVQQAMEEVERALELDPDNDDAQALHGRLLSAAGHDEAAVQALQRALDLRPAYWKHHYDLGIVLFDAGDYEAAQRAFLRVTELQPDSSRGYMMLGTAQHAAGETEAAIENYRLAAALPDGAAAFTNLGVLLYEEGRYEEAAKSFEEAARRSPSSPAKHGNLGDVYRQLARETDALEAYTRAADLARDRLEFNPDDPWAAAQLAIYEAKLGNDDEASRLAALAAQLGPEIAGVRYRAAVALAQAGRIDEGLEALAAAIETGYSRTSAARDTDLDALRGRPEFKQLVEVDEQSSLKGGAG